MVWATVCSRSCFCWLYRASPSLAAKNIISLISVLTFGDVHVLSSLGVIGRGCLLWPVCSLDQTLLEFALLYFVLQGQIRLLLQVSLDFLLLHSSLWQWCGSAVACCRVGGTDWGSVCTQSFVVCCHYLHYLHHSLASSQTTGREYSPTHRQKIGLKIYWTWPCPSEQDPVPHSVSPIRKLP